MICVDTGHNVTCISANHPMTTADFLLQHPVFNLDTARDLLGGDARQRVFHAIEQGRAVKLRRELFATVPIGQDPQKTQPDRYLVMSQVRPGCVLAGHSALELLGMAHSEWTACCAYSHSSRGKFRLRGIAYEVVGHPSQLDDDSSEFGVKQSWRQELPIRHLGPERTLVDGFLRPRLSGGVVELVLSLDGLRLLDLDLVEEVLSRYSLRTLYGAVGWFLERNQRDLFVPDSLLTRLESRVPTSPHYLESSKGRARVMPRWNVLVPTELVTSEEKGAENF